MIANGGLQYVPQLAVQYVYLDFDGELTSYNGEILTVDNVEVKDSSLTEERIAYIVAELNAKYAAQNVIFVTEKPQNAEYSTIYIGKTEAFAPYGNFAGLAETLDTNNTNKTDKAFVMLDSTASDEQIISTISHETDHLLGTLDHGGEDLAAYAVSKTFSSGAHNSMLIISGDDITLTGSATTYSSIISSGGRLTLSSGGSADTVEIRNGGTLILRAGGELYMGVISSGGSIYTASSGTYHIGALDIQNGAIVRVSGDARLSDLTVYSGGVLYLSSGVTSCSRLEVSSGGSVTVYSGATLSGAQLLESKARLCVSSGGSAIHTSLYAGAAVDVYQGGVVTDVHRMGRSSDCQINVRGGSLLNTMLYAIVADIYSGGIVSDAQVNSGTLRVYNGGLANSITISKGGYAVFADYARGSKVTVQSGGHLDIYTTGTVISDLEVESGGILQGFLIGTAQNFSSVSGAEIKPFSNVSIKKSLMTVSSGNVSALGAVVNLAIIHISSGGKVSSLELANGAKCHIKSGGIVSSGEVKNSNTTVVVSSGGQMTGGTLAASATLAVSGGTIRNISATDWSEINLCSGATAENVTVWDDSKLTISAGASAFLPMLQAESGYIDVLGGMCVSALVNNGGAIVITSSGVASKTTLQGSGNGGVYNGKFIDTSVTNGTLSVNSGGNVINTSLGYNGKLVVYSNGTASDTYIDMGGTAIVGGSSIIQSSGKMIDTTVNSGGKLSVAKGGTVENVTVNSGGSMYIDGGGTFTGELTIANGGWVQCNGAIFDLDISDRSTEDNALINVISFIVGSPEFLITVDTDQAYGVYKLASGAGGRDFTFSVRNQLGNTIGSVSTADTVAYNFNKRDYKVSNIGGELTLTVSASSPGLSGDAAGVSWKNLPGTHFVVDYSTNDYTNTLRVGVAGSSLDTYGLPGGTYQWQVKEVNGEFIAGDDIVSDNTSAPQRYVSDDDRKMDLFFARAHGVWDAGYAAEHQGRINMWNGTGERVSLAGKNKISDVFIASGDTNILVLTDDSNGDALFMDDVYTSFGKDDARILMIDEIRAGAGDDIIDLTSQQFAYTGLGMKIYGGLGNDIIWGNTGSNKLFGNAGNDRIIGGTDNDEIIGGSGNDAMHGGGGNDVFCFGENWGND
ncbi:MAG: hypothetical protein IKD44_02875, partial [Lentisphaeria bacterium]|nr:hypothetical protein [Lentisphaeria bacterium]